MSSAWPPFMVKWWQHIVTKAFCGHCGTSGPFTFNATSNQYKKAGTYCQRCGNPVHIFVEVVQV